MIMILDEWTTLLLCTERERESVRIRAGFGSGVELEWKNKRALGCDLE